MVAACGPFLLTLARRLTGDIPCPCATRSTDCRPRPKARLRTRAQPKWVAPMLATLTDEVCSRQGWLFEPKWDGERCLAFRRGRDLNLFSRNRIRLNAKYPEVVEAIYQQQTTSFIADGEIVTFDGDITSFA